MMYMDSPVPITPDIDNILPPGMPPPSIKYHDPNENDFPTERSPRSIKIEDYPNQRPPTTIHAPYFLDPANDAIVVDTIDDLSSLTLTFSGSELEISVVSGNPNIVKSTSPHKDYKTLLYDVQDSNDRDVYEDGQDDFANPFNEITDPSGAMSSWDEVNRRRQKRHFPHEMPGEPKTRQ